MKQWLNSAQNKLLKNIKDVVREKKLKISDIWEEKKEEKKDEKEENIKKKAKTEEEKWRGKRIKKNKK